MTIFINNTNTQVIKMNSNSVLITFCILCNLILLSVCSECETLPDMKYDEVN